MTPWKRALDLSISSLLLVVSAPLLAIIALVVKMDSPGPALYRGKRLGLGGKPFYILKFRTMVQGAANKGAGITTRDDPRVTRAGKLLRRTKLDELPQLVNVVRGEMSLVGPRPEDPRYLHYYTPAQRALLTVPPGITSAASIRFRHEEDLLHGKDWEQKYVKLLGEKLDLELAYLAKRSVWTDLVLLARTFAALFETKDRRNAP